MSFWQAKKDLWRIIYGRNTVNIITNERYKEKIEKFLQYENIIRVDEKLVALSFAIDKKLVTTPGVLFHIIRGFAWENINIIDIISIDLEIIFIVKERDAIVGYKALQRLISL